MRMKPLPLLLAGLILNSIYSLAQPETQSGLSVPAAVWNIKSLEEVKKIIEEQVPDAFAKKAPVKKAAAKKAPAEGAKAKK